MTWRAAVVSTLLLAAACAQTASGPTPANLAPGTVIKAEMATELESANSQVGDQISATLDEDVKQGKTKLAKGTTINGHIVQVTAAKDNDSPSSISVLFNQAVESNGKTYSLLAGIASVARPSASAAPTPRGRGRGGYGRGGGGYPGGGGGYPGGGGGNPGGGEPTATTGTGGSTAVPDIRFPANDATTGSILSSQRGDVWLFPKTKITLQILAAATGQ